MKNFRDMCILAFTLVLTVTTNAQQKVDQEIMADAEKAKVMLQTNNEKLDSFFENSTGYAIFPNVGEGGLIVGGASGNGVVYENGEVVGMADLKKVDVGLQAGGQAITQVIFFETEEALNEFKQGELELSAEAKAVALHEGASIDANYDDGVIVFAKPKEGLMADVSVGGQKFDYTSINNL